jgi:hypothetical protein
MHSKTASVGLSSSIPGSPPRLWPSTSTRPSECGYRPPTARQSNRDQSDPWENKETSSYLTDRSFRATDELHSAVLFRKTRIGRSEVIVLSATSGVKWMSHIWDQRVDHPGRGERTCRLPLTALRRRLAGRARVWRFLLGGPLAPDWTLSWAAVSIFPNPAGRLTRVGLACGTGADGVYSPITARPVRPRR